MESPKSNFNTKLKVKAKAQSLTIAPKLTEFDKIIHAMYEYITSSVHSSIYNSAFSKEEINTLKDIKKSKIKRRRFKKWYIMSYSPNKIKQIKQIPNEEIIDAITHCKLSQSLYIGSHSFISNRSMLLINNDSNVNQQSNTTITETSLISKSEKGIKDFYTNNKAIFTLRVYKSPPDVFRRHAWFTCANIPFNKNSLYYYNLLHHCLDPDIESQINKDINRTIEEQDINLPDLQEPLFRVLKAIALLDKELSYCQGMNFIIGFILIMMNGNEVDAFYLSIALFSQTYTNRYGIRGFYLDGFPLLSLYIYTFEYLFKKKMSKLYDKLKTFEIPSHCWVGKWFQTMFVNTFPEEAIIRIWDGVIAFGLQFLISIALGILSHLETQLMPMEDIEDVANLFKMLNKPNMVNSTNSTSANKKMIQFDIEEVLKKAKNKYYIGEGEMKEFIAMYFESNINRKVNDNEGDGEKDEEGNCIIEKVMNCINSKVEYDYENYNNNQFSNENMNNNNDNTRVDTIYDGDINEFYLNTIECNGKKFEKPLPTKHLFRNPFMSPFLI